MLKEPRVGAIVFYVKDLARTEKFYRDVLGLPTKTVPSHDGPFLMAEAGATLLLFFRREEKVGRTPLVVFTLGRGIDDLVEQLAAKGVQIVLPVSAAPGGGHSSDFLDPDGHILSFYQPEGAPRRMK
jgi:catechol 2,3-dioxygenase-like lactoylglutathione lyase family enzyme